MPKQPVLYEVMYILDARIEEEQRQEAVEVLESHVRAQGGEVVATRDFGRRRLAYEIDGHLEGFYKILYFTGFGECVDEVKHEMHLLPQLIRGMVVVANPNFLYDPDRQMKPAEPVVAEEAPEEEAVVEVPAEEPEAEEAVETEVVVEAPVEEAAAEAKPEAEIPASEEV